jgi:hypothetical protein
VAVAWSAAVVAFIVGVAVTSDDLFLRVELGLVIGAVVAAALLALALSRRLAAGAEPEPGSVITALHEVSIDP